MEPVKLLFFKTIAGVLRPSSGSVRVFDIDVYADPVHVKSLIGVLPETPSLFPELSVKDSLRVIADLYCVRKDSMKSIWMLYSRVNSWIGDMAP